MDRMHPDLERLKSLQEVDREIQRLTDEIATLPRRVADVEAKLASTKSQIEQEKSKIKQNDAAKRGFEISADDSGRVDLTGKPSIVALAPEMPVYGPTGDIFPLSADRGHRLLFRFHANDLGKARFDKEPLKKNGAEWTNTPSVPSSAEPMATSWPFFTRRPSRTQSSFFSSRTRPPSMRGSRGMRHCPFTFT